MNLLTADLELTVLFSANFENHNDWRRNIKTDNNKLDDTISRLFSRHLTLLCRYMTTTI